MKQYYRLLLKNYATPAFVSFPKAYFGTLEQMDGFFRAIKTDAERAEEHTDLLAAYDQYVAGNTAVCHCAAFQEVPLLVPVTVLAEETAVLTAHSWDHINIWDCPCNMKCDRVECTHIWLSCDDRYIRCIRVKFTNLLYEGIIGGYHSFGAMAWGFPHQVEYDEPYTFSRLFVEEKEFKDEAEAINDRLAFVQNPDPIFVEVMDDLFGNG